MALYRCRTCGLVDKNNCKCARCGGKKLLLKEDNRMIKAKRKSKTTAVCPDCGKQHRIHRVSQGEYIKGCIYPCCVYWVEDNAKEANKGG